MGRAEAGARLLLGWEALEAGGTERSGVGRDAPGAHGQSGSWSESRNLFWTGMREGQLGWRHEIVLLPVIPTPPPPAFTPFSSSSLHTEHGMVC